MKITKEHYTHLARAMESKMEQYPRKSLSKVSDKRYGWDMLHESGLTPWVCSTLYDYLDDTHIDTALRKIVREF